MNFLNKKTQFIIGMLVASSTFYGYSVGDELVTNGTFGYGGTANLDNWSIPAGSSSWRTAVDAPSGVDTYSAEAFGDSDGGNLLFQNITITVPGKYSLSAYVKANVTTIGSMEFNQGSDLNILNIGVINTTWAQTEPFLFNLTSMGEYTLNLITPTFDGTQWLYFADVSLQLVETNGGQGVAVKSYSRPNASSAANNRNDVVFGTSFNTATIQRTINSGAAAGDFDPTGTATGNTLSVSVEGFSEESLVADSNKVPSKNITTTSNNTNVWGVALGQYMHQKKANHSNGFTTGSGGTVVGADWTFSKQSVGFAASYVYTYFNILKNQGHTNINQGTVAPYAVFRFADWISNVSVLGGYAHDDNHRHFKSSTTNYHTHGSSHGWQLSPHLDIAYNGFFKNSWFNVVPYAMGDYVANWQSKWSEVGSSDGKTSQKAKFYGFIKAESGFRFYETINIRYGKLILKEKGAYSYQRSTSSKSNTVSVIGSAEAFVVPISTHIQNLFVGELSMKFVSGKKYVPDVEVSYEGQFGSKFIAQTGTVNLSKKF